MAKIAESAPLVDGGRVAVEWHRTTWLRAGGDFFEGEVDGMVEAERHAVGVGPLELFTTEGLAYLVEAFLAPPRS